MTNDSLITDVEKIFNNWNYHSAIRLYKRILDSWYVHIDLVYNLGFSYFEIWDYKNLSLLYNKYKLVFYKNPKILELKLLFLGTLWKYRRVIDYSGILLDEGYTSEVLIVLLGVSFRNIWEYTKAIELFRNYLEKNNSDVIEYNLASIYYLQGEYKKALSFIKNESLYYIELKGKILKNQWCSQYKLRKFYNQYIDFKKEYKNDNTLIGNLYYNMWEYTESLKYYKKSLSIIPYDYYAYNWIWNCLKKVWKIEESIVYYMKSLLINKYLVYSYNSIWGAYYLLKDFHKSLNYYEHSLTINQNNFYTLKGIWDCYFKLNDYSKAYNAYHDSFELNMKNHMVKRKLKQLWKLWYTIIT